MEFERVDTRHLFTDMRQSLITLLGGLTPEQWARPTACGTWTVRDIAGHLLGVDLGNLARHRDDHSMPAPSDVAELPRWIDDFNEEWVRAVSRLSDRLLVDLLDLSGRWFEDYLGQLDLEAMGESVSWAGPDPAPVWLDVAREYTERWVHQQQIRHAVERPGLCDDRFLGAVVSTFVCCLPLHYDDLEAPVGTVLRISVTGPGGGGWCLRRLDRAWTLTRDSGQDGDGLVQLDADAAWRLLTGALSSADVVHRQGDARLTDHFLTARAIIV
jgi:uncharacterized protein (TIGR03083 family)